MGMDKKTLDLLEKQGVIRVATMPSGHSVLALDEYRIGDYIFTDKDGGVYPLLDENNNPIESEK
jgi:hypothetical protein